MINMKLLATPEETKKYNDLKKEIIRLANADNPKNERHTQICPCCKESFLFPKNIFVGPNSTLLETEKMVSETMKDSESMVILTKVYGYYNDNNEQRCDYYYCTCGAKWRSCHYSIPNQSEIIPELKNIHNDKELEKLAETFVEKDPKWEDEYNENR